MDRLKEVRPKLPPRSGNRSQDDKELWCLCEALPDAQEAEGFQYPIDIVKGDVWPDFVIRQNGGGEIGIEITELSDEKAQEHETKIPPSAQRTDGAESYIAGLLVSAIKRKSTPFRISNQFGLKWLLLYLNSIGDDVKPDWKRVAEIAADEIRESPFDLITVLAGTKLEFLKRAAASAKKQ